MSCGHPSEAGKAKVRPTDNGRSEGQDGAALLPRPETGQPHVLEHSVTEEEVRQVLLGRGDDFRGKGSARNCYGQTSAGRYLKVVYVPDQDRDSVFVITA
jgi:hypothetical protein